MKVENTPEFEEFVKDGFIGGNEVGKTVYLLDRGNNVWLRCNLFKIEIGLGDKVEYTGTTCIGTLDSDDCFELTSDISCSEHIFNDLVENFNARHDQPKVTNVVFEFVSNVNDFNYFAGKVEKPLSYKALKNQSKRIEEELNELYYKGVADNNPKEILDGIVDVLVTSFGLAQLLEANGYNVAKAMQKIATNNMSKILGDFELANDTVKMYQDKGEDCYIKNVEDCFTVLRRSDDKIMKPIGYVSVDINDCLPD